MHKGNKEISSHEEQGSILSTSDVDEIDTEDICNMESSPGKIFNQLLKGFKNKYKENETSTNQETLACILDRLTKIEGRVDEITKKSQHSSQKKEEASTVDFNIFFARISQLEQEKSHFVMKI